MSWMGTFPLTGNVASVIVVADGVTVSSPIDKNVTTIVAINNTPKKIHLELDLLSVLLIILSIPVILQI